ncbi:MAG: hypothetical protein RMJ56_08200 [Gemmataceae bacterium]|nr:hypothetical protein [Gemmata sp.]MDW8197572.1 hypothetical protein [Gemmataceae bacterium]
MVRFDCPQCQRPYELLPALAGLPLVCKHCGQRISAPRGSSPPPVTSCESWSPPPPPSRGTPVVPPPLVPLPAPGQPAPGQPVWPEDQLDDDDILVTKPDSSPDIDFNVAGPTLVSRSDIQRQRFGQQQSTGLPADTLGEIKVDFLAPPILRPPSRPLLEPSAPRRNVEKPDSVLWPGVVDRIVLVLLIATGMMLGEWLVGKSTQDVLAEAAWALQFPLRDLLLWAAAPVALSLGYRLCHKRQATVGAWLWRRRGS